MLWIPLRQHPTLYLEQERIWLFLPHYHWCTWQILIRWNYFLWLIFIYFRRYSLLPPNETTTAQYEPDIKKADLSSILGDNVDVQSTQLRFPDLSQEVYVLSLIIIMNSQLFSVIVDQDVLLPNPTTPPATTTTTTSTPAGGPISSQNSIRSFITTLFKVSLIFRIYAAVLGKITPTRSFQRKTMGDYY